MKRFSHQGLRAFAMSCAAVCLPAPADAQQTILTTEQLKARCSQLIAYYDRFGVGRSVHSDGRRNFDRISASLDCSQGRYAEGIAIMEDLLRRKKFTSPALGLPDEPEDDN
jgi:hypothetical protein